MRSGADGASKLFFATERLEDTRHLLSLQQSFLVRRGIASALALIVAELAFPLREGAWS